MAQGEVSFTYSGILNKGHKKIICVRFERSGGKDYAEGQIPECRLDKSKGFTEEELRQMEQYLQKEKDNIIQEARKLTSIKHLLS